MSEIEDKLITAVKKMSELSDKDKVNIKGKMYAEVHTRVQVFREAFGVDGKIISKVHTADESRVMTESSIHVFVDGTWREIGNDFAEEFRNAGMVNKTSAVENCLTSSIGRALSAIGLSGGNYASFEEVDHAINDKEEAPSTKKYKMINSHNKVAYGTDDLEEYLNKCRDQMSKPDQLFCRKVYERNVADIKKAHEDANGEIKVSFETLISLYEKSEVQDDN